MLQARSCPVGYNPAKRSCNGGERPALLEPCRMPEHPELGEIAAEEEGDGPIDDDAELPLRQRQLVQVIAPCDEPAEEAAEPEAEHVGDALVAAERRHLPEHPVAVRLRVTPEVLRKPAGLAEGVLAGRRVRRAAAGVRNA